MLYAVFNTAVKYAAYIGTRNNHLEDYTVP